MTTFILLDESESIFDSKAELLVNPVNCVGVMGAGLAKAFKTNFPDNFRNYKIACDSGILTIGRQTVFFEKGKGIINFPTKKDWRDKSEYDYIASGLSTLRKYLCGGSYTSIAIPALGCGLGGLEWEKVKASIIESLQDIEDLIVYLYEPVQ